MEAPTCRLCKGKHWGNEPHAWPKEKVVHAGSPRAADIGSSQIKADSRHGKYADLDKRKKYRREWMRNKRAT